MAFILSKIIDDTGPSNQSNITRNLTDIEDRAKAKYKYANKTSNFNKLKIYSKIPDQIREEIKVLNIGELQKRLNQLFIELYTKYEPSINKNSIPQIKETVNSITKYGTIEYKELSDKIKNIFSEISKSSNLEDLIIFLELKIVIDKFFELIGGTNFEVKKYNLFSSKIDMDLSQKISKSELKNKSNKITKEITKKTIEELKTKANELIQRLSKYLSNNNNSRSIASTISGNQNQSRINNSELKPLKNS
jgi:ribosomal protein L29